MIASPRKPGFRIGASFRVAFSPDGRYLATVGKRTNVWDVAARQRLASAKPFSHESEIDISADSRRLVVKNTSGDVAVYDIELEDEPLILSGKPYGEGDEIRFSCDGKFIVDSSWRGHCHVRDSVTGEVVWTSDRQATRVTPRRDRSVWAFVTDGGVALQRWPFWDNSPIVCAPPYDRSGYDIGLARFALADNSDRLVVATGVTLEIWVLDTSQGESVASAKWPTAISGSGDAVAWHPSENFVAHAGAGAASILTDDLAPTWHEEFVNASDVAFSADGSLLAVGDWSKGAVVAIHQ